MQCLLKSNNHAPIFTMIVLTAQLLCTCACSGAVCPTGSASCCCSHSLVQSHTSLNFCCTILVTVRVEWLYILPMLVLITVITLLLSLSKNRAFSVLFTLLCGSHNELWWPECTILDRALVVTWS